MKNKTKINGIPVEFDDGDESTSDIVYYDKTYAKEKDRERDRLLKDNQATAAQCCQPPARFPTTRSLWPLPGWGTFS